jgi:hypothetical protein
MSSSSAISVPFVGAKPENQACAANCVVLCAMGVAAPASSETVEGRSILSGLPRQRDGISCGPSVAVMAGALLDPDYGAPLRSESGQAWFDAEQLRVHRAVNVVWPRALGASPAGVARALTMHSSSRDVYYRWRPACGEDRLADVCDAVAAGWPVALLIGSVIPRHWVLLTELDGAVFRCYEPSSGEMVDIPIADIRGGRLSRLGFPHPFAFVVPCIKP